MHNRLQVGIDFSQKRADFCLLFPEGQPLESHVAFDNSYLGYSGAKQLLLDTLDEYPFDIIDYKSRLNREGRSANLAWYQEFKKVDAGDVSWDDVLKMNPADGVKFGLKTGDTVKVSSVAGSIVVTLKLWEGVRPGTVAKCYGQGHWAYGRMASKDYAKSRARGGNINDILVDDYDRLSGASARNGGFTGVKIQKV